MRGEGETEEERRDTTLCTGLLHYCYRDGGGCGGGVERGRRRICLRGAGADAGWNCPKRRQLIRRSRGCCMQHLQPAFSSAPHYSMTVQYLQIRESSVHSSLRSLYSISHQWPRSPSSSSPAFPVCVYSTLMMWKLWEGIGCSSAHLSESPARSSRCSLLQYCIYC